MLLLVKRTFVVAAFGALLLSACGGASLSLSEYSDEVAALIIGVDGRLDAHAELTFSAAELTTLGYLSNIRRAHDQMVISSMILRFLTVPCGLRKVVHSLFTDFSPDFTAKPLDIVFMS